MGFVYVDSHWLWFCAISCSHNLSLLLFPLSYCWAGFIAAMRGRRLLRITERWSSQQEAIVIGFLIIATAPSTTSAITVILITLYVISCWRLYTSVSSTDSSFLCLSLSLMTSLLSYLLTCHVHKWTAAFNLSLLSYFYILVPIRYMVSHQYKGVIWLLFVQPHKGILVIGR